MNFSLTDRISIANESKNKIAKIDVERQISKFKVNMMRRFPFYGDIIMNIEFEEDESYGTAATDGRTIYFSRSFFERQREGQLNYIIMHEVLHILLLHCDRERGDDDPLWNIACDVTVNNIIDRMVNPFAKSGIPLERPDTGIFEYCYGYSSTEALYNELCVKNGHVTRQKEQASVQFPSGSTKEVKLPSDVIIRELSKSEREQMAKDIKRIAMLSALKNKEDMPSEIYPYEIMKLIESKNIEWDVILKNFLCDVRGEDLSYFTPERKYIHMDLILPGPQNETTLHNVWIFIDSSCSVDEDELGEFLTQVYRITKRFQCAVNICYWDTSVTDVYRNVRAGKSVLKCRPTHSGGTDINCVYQWLEEHRVKPTVMMIMTDGYFGPLDARYIKNSLKRKTVYLLTDNNVDKSRLEKYGAVTRL